MSDSIDRVFVKAISTIRALSSHSNYGLPRPPPEARIKLYGLYKQATEGDVEGIMPRPVGFTAEDEGAKKKWDAWARERGVSKTEAKRRYITFLIETMKMYASGTLEARELLAELEYVWDQIKDVQFESDDEENEEKFAMSLRSPSFGPSDRMSTGTPSVVPNVAYRNNLQRIYSHSRRSTGPRDYAPRQPPYGGSVYSLPARRAPNSELAEIKAWQGKVNTLISKLTQEIVTQGREDPEDDWREQLRRRVAQVLRFLGEHAVRVVRNFATSLLVALFVVWYVKKSVRVKQEVLRSNSKRELVVHMFIDTEENKWFIRVMRFVNGFVGFV